jgi:hypothetical protein
VTDPAFPSHRTRSHQRRIHLQAHDRLARHPYFGHMDKSARRESYEIRIGSRLDERWSDWFDGFLMTCEDDVTVLRGSVADQSALHGLLARIRDLSLPLIEVRRIPPLPRDGVAQTGTPSKEEQ